jgi:hypothetical protein
VTVAVLGRAGAVAVARERAIDVRDEVRVGQVDPGIEDRDARPDAGEPLVAGIRRGRPRGPDPGDARRGRLGGDPDRAIGDHVADIGSLLEGLGLLGGPAEHEAAQCVLEDGAGLPADLLRKAGSGRPRIDTGSEADDPAGGCLARGIRPGIAARS